MRGLTIKLKWRIAGLVNILPNQCWANLVGWVLRDHKDDPGAGLAANLPWRPIGESCRRDAQAAGRCYCGSLGSDGTVLKRGESVCVTRMPGRENDRLCSLPDGHDGMHRCGGVEWQRINADDGGAE